MKTLASMAVRFKPNHSAQQAPALNSKGHWAYPPLIVVTKPPTARRAGALLPEDNPNFVLGYN